MLDYFEDELFEAEGGEDYTEDRVLIDGELMDGGNTDAGCN
jgi:hypothetical protein